MFLTVVFCVVLNCTNLNSRDINVITLDIKFEIYILPSISKLQILLLPHGGAIIARKIHTGQFRILSLTHAKGFSDYQVLMMIIYLFVFLWLYFLGFFLMNRRWLSISKEEISITLESFLLPFPNRLKKKNSN